MYAVGGVLGVYGSLGDEYHRPGNDVTGARVRPGVQGGSFRDVVVTGLRLKTHFGANHEGGEKSTGKRVKTAVL